MNRDEVREVVLSILGEIAPEVDRSTIRADADLRDELDIDSMDFLRLVVRIDERLGVAIPEGDYPSVRTLAGCVGYVAGRVASRAAGEAAEGARPA
jgi:acyl carrier protein